VKKIEIIETPTINVERHPLVLIISLLVTFLLCYITYRNVFKREAFDINPLVFFLFVPTLLISFQTLWLILNPFALFYNDRMEIKRSLFSSKIWYFRDIKKVGEVKKNFCIISYNDNDMEKINLIGIKPAHKKLFRDEFLKYIQPLA
jgi:hypothetical protein